MYETSVFSAAYTALFAPEKKKIGMPFKRAMLKGVTRLMDVGGLVVTWPRRPMDMRCARERMEVPPRKCASCVCVAALRFLWVQRLGRNNG